MGKREEWTRNWSKCVRKGGKRPPAWKTNLVPEAEGSEELGRKGGEAVGPGGRQTWGRRLGWETGAGCARKPVRAERSRLSRCRRQDPRKKRDEELQWGVLEEREGMDRG